MCGYASTEKGYEALVVDCLRAAQRQARPDMVEYYRGRARSLVQYAQRYEAWLKDYDPITCIKKPPPPAKRPSVAPGMKVVREAIREATRTPEPPAPTREPTKQLAA